MRTSTGIQSSLDDMVFEGRNQDYGAYNLRKTNRRRLLRSFGLATILFLLLVAIYPISDYFSPTIYDQGLYNYQIVNLNMRYDPLVMMKNEKSAGTSAVSTAAPDKIVDDNQVVEPQQDVKQPSDGHSDSTATANAGTGDRGNGTSNGEGEGTGGDVYGSADINPQFPGGPRAMQDFINANIRYPENALNMNIRGTILVFVVVMSDGSLRDIKIVRGLHPELDKEVLRLVNSMPRWMPAKRGGVPVNVRCTLPITVSSKMGKM